MKVTRLLTVNIDNVPVTDQGRRVYRAAAAGARTTAELSAKLGMSEAMVDLQLAHLMRHDLVGLAVQPLDKD